MKEIVKKIIESGLVDKHTVRLMERWGSLERGTADLVEDVKLGSREQLVQFVEDIEGLLEEERESLRETRFSITVGDPLHVRILEGDGNQNIVAFRDEMGNLLLPPSTENVEIDDVLYIPSTGEYYDICSITPLYQGEVKYALQVEIKLLD